ncbi:non-specific lipid-transfer protein 1-like protein, partial [Tanacetum coccineum]
MASMVMKLSCVVVMMVVLLALSAPEVEALTCGHVRNSIGKCLGYLMHGGALAPDCCNGVRRLRNEARTTADRKTICNCLKSASSSYPSVKENYVSSLPGKCGVNFPYKISLYTNCN